MRIPADFLPRNVGIYNFGKKKKLSLTHVLAASFAAQLVAVVGLTSGLSFYNSQKATHELAHQLENEVVNHVSTKLDNYLSSPPQINHVNVNAFEAGILNISDLSTLGTIFWKQMQTFPVGYISFANPQGDFIGIERMKDGQHLRNEIDKRAAHHMQVFTTNQRGEKEKLIERKSYNPYIEPWYTDAVKAGKPLWSKIYQWDDKPDVISISHSYPLYNAENQLLGVMSVDYLLTQLSDFLRNLRKSQYGKVFIVEPNGLIVASSVNEKPYLVKNGTAHRLNALNSSDPSIRAATQHLINHFGNLSAAASPSNTANQYHKNLILNGDLQHIQIRKWQDRYGLDWIIIVVMPESKLMAHINSSSQLMAAICIGAVLLAIWLGIITARWITKPILEVSNGTVALASKFNNDDILTDANSVELTIDRGTTEVQMLTASFNQMAQRLQGSFKTLAAVNSDLEFQVAQKTAALKQAEDATKEAQSAARLKDEFLANMSHELRTPLNAILGMSECLIDEVLGTINPKQSKAITTIEKSGMHLLDVINDILELAKIEAGKLDLCYEPTSIDQLCQDSINFVYQQAQQKQIKIITKIPNSVPNFLLDERRIRQVLINLLNNAVKFTPENGQITLSVSYEQPIDDMPVHLHISVTDTGIGITSENLHKLFQSFSQIDSALNRQYDGTGLGLALVKKIVERHGGTVSVTSEIGLGSCFSIHLSCSDA